jgi:hypothetical protein
MVRASSRLSVGDGALCAAAEGWNRETTVHDLQPDAAVEAMLAVAAREVDETWLASWLRERVTFRT